MMACRTAFRGCGVGRIHPSLNDIHRIRGLFGGEDMQLGGAVDEEGGLVTDGQEGEGDGAHNERSGQLPPFFVVFHSLVVWDLCFCGFGMFFSDRCTCHDQDNLSFGFMFFVPGGYLGQRAAPVFFVDFGNGDTNAKRMDAAIRSQLHALVERLLKYKKIIVGINLEDWNAIELVVGSGIEYVASDVFGPYAPGFVPLKEKDELRLKEMKGNRI